MRRSYLPYRAAAAVLAMGLAASACGSGGPSASPELASLDPTVENAADAPAAAASSGPPSEAEITRLLEEYRDCYMSENIDGINIEVSIDPDGFPVVVHDVADVDNAVLEELEGRCEPLLDPLFAAFIGDAETVAARTEFSTVLQACLAEEGFFFDIDAQSGFLEVSIDVEGDGSDEVDDAEFEPIEEACNAQAFAETGFEIEGG